MVVTLDDDMSLTDKTLDLVRTRSFEIPTAGSPMLQVLGPDRAASGEIGSTGDPQPC